jgi:hypothetical protein
MLTRLETISSNLRNTDELLKVALSDLPPHSITRQTRNGDGPSIHWLIEHLMNMRITILNLLGSPQPESRNLLSSATEASEIIGRWSALADKVHYALAHCSAETLDGPARGGPHGETTAFGLINFLVWHEGYHFGGLGVARREFGMIELAALVRAQNAAAKEEVAVTA